MVLFFSTHISIGTLPCLLPLLSVQNLNHSSGRTIVPRCFKAFFSALDTCSCTFLSHLILLVFHDSDFKEISHHPITVCNNSACFHLLKSTSLEYHLLDIVLVHPTILASNWPFSQKETPNFSKLTGLQQPNEESSNTKGWIDSRAG
jgi:hypothetical protein